MAYGDLYPSTMAGRSFYIVFTSAASITLTVFFSVLVSVALCSLLQQPADAEVPSLLQAEAYSSRFRELASI